ncbi:AEC family transporter [Liquorilactobacillus satsumensis]|uniref:Transport protein n=1 Tax=Liquorilactobacillus satsumensis DSM 16230 = JCM 12392 TaxID=1423801 RepID=A0A0R1V0P0_9LACO|nr:AEC family transporter [Liquorilactobacillus satsumensis]KRL99062.1 transport protein [Liquorilactobacillus satsumensis DSM 16230 = JCM 12392]MCC7667689.1 transporter [Liquorilactobacillus satsumensis]MCP9312298.1 AEC family transporter [Liquorilactobacillus satsumensis]MCP9328803.1 AEC family transporter [Liquorilactobacillus satsumensis]MCP9357149.1 AEC family transporter [Liquorilactobacillus satsumensis]
MSFTLVVAIAPIIFTLALGYLAGLLKQFDKNASQLFIDLVMSYALPLSLFGGLLATQREVIIHDLPLFLWLGVGMLLVFVILIILYNYLCSNLGLAVLRALSVACPSVPFMGTSVLAIIFGGTDSVILVAICGLYLNLVQVPLSVLLLSVAKAQKKDTFGSAASAKQRLLSALKKPLVWAPILGFTLNLTGFHLATRFQPLFSELGQAAGGVALFSIGIMLYTQKFHLTIPVLVNVLLKNIGLPLVVWGIMLLFHESFHFQQMVIATLAIPTAAMPSMLGIQNHLHEDEMASTQLVSTLLAVITMSVFLVLLRVG